MADNKKPAMKSNAGRPRTTLEDLPKNWQNIMLNCGKEGGSEVEMRVLLGIGESAWGTLLADYEEFRGTRKKAKDLCAVWWEKRGREMATGEDGNPTVWIFNMKNRFGWRDKTEIDQTVKAEMNHHVSYADAVAEALKAKHKE